MRQLLSGMFQPSAHGLKQRPGTCVAILVPLFGGTASNFLFDPVESPDAFYCLGCDRPLMSDHQIEELAADVRHARSFVNGPWTFERRKQYISKYGVSVRSCHRCGKQRGGLLWDRFTVHYTPKHGS